MATAVAVIAVLALLAQPVVALVMQRQAPKLNPRRDLLDDYATGASRRAYVAFAIVTALGWWASAAAICLVLPTWTYSAGVALFLGLVGLIHLVFIWVPPTPNGAPRSARGLVHQILAGLAVLWQFSVAWSSWQIARSWHPRWYILVLPGLFGVCVAALVVVVGSWFFEQAQARYAGLLQRIFRCSIVAYFLAFDVWLVAWSRFAAVS